MRLLVTRPEPDARATAAVLRARGHDVIVAPLLTVELLDPALPEQAYAAVVMTSANAARAVARHHQRDRLVRLPVLTVGRHTAEAAQVAGFGTTLCADADGAALSALLRGRFARADQALLYLAGEDRAVDLGTSRARIETVVVYRAVKAAEFPAAVIDALPGLDGVLHFSRRTAESFITCARNADLMPRAMMPVHFCLSAQVAQPLEEAGAAHIRIPPDPAAAALIDLIG